MQTSELQNAIENRELNVIKDLLEKISLTGAELDVKLIQKAQLMQEKLETQNKIMDFLNKNRHVDEYKTILKTVRLLQEYIEEARTRKVDLDEELVREVYDEVERLKAERNLRFQLDNLDVPNATVNDWNVLKELMRIAEEREVETEYIEKASELSVMIEKNLRAREIKLLFKDYPFREYPDPIFYDPKTKKPLDPITKKPIDPKKLAPPKKKKKKKEPKYVIPEWATEIPVLESAIKELDVLFKIKEEINITEGMITESIEDIERMKKEVRYRKQLEEEAKILAEKKAAAKKKR